MLSRRNVRIKVMQILYALRMNSDMDKAFALKRYENSIEKSFELLIFTMWQLLKVAAYAEQDYAFRKNKFRPTPDDLAFRPILWQNELVLSLSNNQPFLEYVKKYKIPAQTDPDSNKQLYKAFAKTEEYRQFLDGKIATLDILLQLFKFLLKHEIFIDILEEQYPTWEDDRSLLLGAGKKIIKALPLAPDDPFIAKLYPSEEAVRTFGESLLKQIAENGEALESYIYPLLENWDPKRVAAIDMILLMMGTCEFLNFETIPPKVSLNEYVDMAKVYSTDKSKEFINGILDKLMKQLKKDGKMIKSGRGLLE